jgi:hypothetical protein
MDYGQEDKNNFNELFVYSLFEKETVLFTL